MDDSTGNRTTPINAEWRQLLPWEVNQDEFLLSAPLLPPDTCFYSCSNNNNRGIGSKDMGEENLDQDVENRRCNHHCEEQESTSTTQRDVTTVENFSLLNVEHVDSNTRYGKIRIIAVSLVLKMAMVVIWAVIKSDWRSYGKLVTAAPVATLSPTTSSSPVVFLVEEYEERLLIPQEALAAEEYEPISGGQSS